MNPSLSVHSAPGRAVDRAYAALYFAVQRARGGVDLAMIRRAVEVLDGTRAQIVDHVCARLREVHGAGPEGREFEWLTDQPLVDRGSLRSSMSRLVRVRPPRSEVRRTSGSSGMPFTFVKSREMTAWMDATMWAAYGWHGIVPGLPHARFWGTPPEWRGRVVQRMKDRLLHQRRLSAFEATPGRSRRFYERLARFKPEYAYGYPNVMRAFVEHCRDARLDGRELRCRVVICTGELLLPQTRAVLEAFFGCPVVNEYGCTESGILGLDCEYGGSHLIPVAAYAEIVSDDGRPVEGESVGETVVTDLFGSAAPLLRYRLYDGAATIAGKCRCGRELPRFELKRGRLGSFIQTPAGGQIFSTILPYTVPTEVRRFRVTQTGSDSLDAEIVVDEHADPLSVVSDCRRRWEAALGPGMAIKFEVVPSISPDASGKLRYFVPLSEQ